MIDVCIYNDEKGLVALKSFEEKSCSVVLLNILKMEGLYFFNHRKSCDRERSDKSSLFTSSFKGGPNENTCSETNFQ